MSLDGTTELPAVGKVKKSYVLVGAALVAGIVGVAWYRRIHASTSGSSAADSADGGLYADTRTGSALASDTYTNPAPANADGQSGTGIGGDSTWQAPHTDQEWAQQAVDRLSWYEPGYVSSVVGKYLARQPLASTEASVVRELWGLIGHPPGNQPIVAATTPAATSTPLMHAPTGVRVTKYGETYATLDWSALPGAKGYKLFINGAQRGNSVVYSTGTIDGLKKGTKYTLGVAGIYSGDKTGPVSTVTVTTKK